MELDHQVTVCRTLEVPELVLSHWWAEMDFGWVVVALGFLDLVLTCWWAGLVPDMAFPRSGVSLACWCVRLGPRGSRDQYWLSRGWSWVPGFLTAEPWRSQSWC